MSTIINSVFDTHSNQGPRVCHLQLIWVTLLVWGWDVSLSTGSYAGLVKNQEPLLGG